MSIVVSENIVGAAMDALRRNYDVAFEPELWDDPARLQELLSTAGALIVRNQTNVTAELMNSAKHLKIVARAGAGLDNIDTRAARRANIVVSYTPRENSLSVAELTIGLMLALARKICSADRDTRQGGWHRHEYSGVELSGKTLGVVGLGRIGSLTAERGRAMGMQIVAHDDYIDPGSETVRELNVLLVSLDELLAQSDFVTTHVPLTGQTRGMFNFERLSSMKPLAFLINASRGEVVDEAGLLRALDEKQIAGAALDVRGVEPPTLGRLETFENVILTPHIGAFTAEAQERVVAAVCDDVVAVLNGRAPRNALG